MKQKKYRFLNKLFDEDTLKCKGCGGVVIMKENFGTLEKPICGMCWMKQQEGLK